eukprot:gene23390-28382_t
MSSNTGDYCHFNPSNSSNYFYLELFHHEIHFIQHPGRTDLGHGVVVWDAGVIFAKYLEHSSSNAYKDLTVLELGSGCGIGGLALMLCGANVTFTDLPEIVEQITKPNISRIFSQLKTNNNADTSTHHPTHQPTITTLDWTNPDETSLLPSYDVILLTDCVFSLDLVDKLVARLSESFALKSVGKKKLHPDYCNDFVELCVGRKK